MSSSKKTVSQHSCPSAWMVRDWVLKALRWWAPSGGLESSETFISINHEFVQSWSLLSRGSSARRRRRNKALKSGFSRPANSVLKLSPVLNARWVVLSIPDVPPRQIPFLMGRSSILFHPSAAPTPAPCRLPHLYHRKMVVMPWARDRYRSSKETQEASILNPCSVHLQ